MKIVFSETEQRHKDFFQERLQGHELLFWSGPIDASNAGELADVDVASVFIYSKLTAEALEKMAALRCIVTRSTGFDHIDLEACKKKGVVVCNVPYYGENTVAEHTFGLILNLSRNIHKSYVRALRDDFSIADLQGFDLQGKTLGVIGVGHIGLHVIKIAKGFGMHVIAFDRKHDDFLAGLLHYRYAKDLDEVLREADIITLHLPALPSTVHIIGREEIAKMKKGAILVNTARGSLVDTDALYEGLASGHLGGAGLDVIEGEELIKEEKELLFRGEDEKLKRIFRDKAILRMENVVFTPHNAFNSREAVQRILETTLKNILAFGAGAPVNTVELR